MRFICPIADLGRSTCSWCWHGRRVGFRLRMFGSAAILMTPPASVIGITPRSRSLPFASLSRGASPSLRRAVLLARARSIRLWQACCGVAG